MRLQLQIHRHSLPAVHIIHSTGTGPAPRTGARESTIADLLLDINDIVPLESADGEWGLEDYVVEVAATVDQDSAYECLHYQTCSALLRDDDEVIVRPLSNEDLRVRRLGGRHQITADGRHLIDGVTFGKQWLRKISRPGITIPPRKRRRLEIDEPELDQSPEMKQILPLQEHDYSRSLVVIPSDDDDDDDAESEDDGDFVDENDLDNNDRQVALREHFDDDDEEESEDDEDFVDENDLDNNDRQVALREHFDDADTQSEDPSEDLAVSGESVDDLSNEVQLLLQDAAELANSPNSKTSFRTLRKHLKRKRDITEDADNDADDDDDGIFQGFSTPVKPHSKIDSSAADSPEEDSASDEDDDNLSDDIESDAESISSSSSDTDSISSASSSSASTSGQSDSESEADSHSEHNALHQAKQRALRLVKLWRADHLPEPNSGEITDESVSSSDGQRSPTNQDPSSTSESDTTSDSDETSTSESEGEAETLNIKEASAASSAKSAVVVPLKSPKVDKLTVASVSAPGKGSNRTHQNNERVKKRRRLTLLKSQGILSEDADFQSLQQYEQQVQTKSTGTDEAVEPLQENANTAKGLADAGAGPETSIILSQEHLTETAAQPIETADPQVSGEATEAAPESETSTPRRARLDLASSRRMLFSSLGLRTPKDKAAEQALREKLSTLVRPEKTANAPPNSTKSPTVQAAAPEKPHDSWKNNLVLSAVECEREGMTLSTPPFPFQQGWWKAKNADTAKFKLRDRDEGRYNEDDDDKQAFAPDVSTLDYGNDEGLTVSEGNATQLQRDTGENIRVPDTFDDLPNLVPIQLRPGAIIAYKQLQLDESTNYQPEVSAYVVGRITAVDEHDFEISLAKQFWRDASRVRIDEETGKKILGKFEMELDDGNDESEDGLRRLDFSALITPKLIENSPIEVPASGHDDQSLIEQEGSRPNESDFNCIPESAEHENHDSVVVGPVDMEGDLVVTTPRRTEITAIIKEAGFDSALDDDLLEPIADPAAEDKGSYGPCYAPPSKQGGPPTNLESDSIRAQSLNGRSSPLANDGRGSLDLHYLDDDRSLLPSDVVSSPFVHTQETVEYPHISQIELDSLEAAKNNSSSHQDAQRVSDEPPVDLSFSSDSGSRGTGLVAIEPPEPSQEDQGLSSPHSELPQSSSPSHEHRNGADEVPSRKSSFLGARGYDGQDSSDLEDDDDGSSSDNSLPSVRELTSSQPNGRPTRLSIKGERRKPIPPPPTKKGLRSSQAKPKSVSPSSPELPSLQSSPANMKLSQSQQQPRLSQIPAESHMIDLTLSSDVSSPVKGGTKKGATRTKRETQANGNGASISSLPSSSAGIGTRRLLTKKRSYV